MLGCTNVFKLNEHYLCNDIETNMVTHTTPLEGNIFFQLLDQLIILSKRVFDHLEKKIV